MKADMDEPLITPERAMGYIITLLAGIGIGASIVALAIWMAVK
jgi:hypothetical protein